MAELKSARKRRAGTSSDSRFYTPAFAPKELGPDFADPALAADGAKIRAWLNNPNISEYERDRLEHLERLHSMQYFGY